MSFKSNELPERINGSNGFSAHILSQDIIDHSDSRHLSLILRDGEEQLYRIIFPTEQPAESLIQKTLLFFRHDSKWREHFKAVEETPVWHHSQPASLHEYDPLAASYFEALGLEVAAYNKGANHPMGNPCTLSLLGHFPDAVASVLQSNGWLVSASKAVIRTPHGYNHLGIDAFRLLLDDWSANHLDPTGDRYRVVRPPLPLIPAWPPYPESALEENLEVNQEKAQFLNRFLNLATFDHYVRLTSGRDIYSTMNLDQLIKAVGEQDEAVTRLDAVAENPTLMAKALRWRLRGLNPMHTLEKYRVDLILHQSAHTKREEARKRRERESTCPDPFA